MPVRGWNILVVSCVSSLVMAFSSASCSLVWVLSGVDMVHICLSS